MKIEFIKRGAATRLILIFAGWSTDARYYNDCLFDGWDTAVISDYRDLSMPAIPDQYSTVYVFAYSLGVFAASRARVKAAARVAICGSPLPVSDIYGIPEAIYSGTLEGLSEKSLKKFHLRMAGDKATFESMKTKLPENFDMEFLKAELSAIRSYSQEVTESRVMRYSINGRDARFVRPRASGSIKFDRVYIAEEDRIFPKENLKAYWDRCEDTEIVNLKSPHAVDIASIIRNCLPDTAAIGEGFARSRQTYNENAVVQKEICEKICEKLSSFLSSASPHSVSLLEIGPGSGLLTEGWRRIIYPERATYIDLAEMPEFCAAKEEIYIREDAEKWFEESDEKYDVILSASTIQWFSDPIRFVSSISCHLNPGGIAILSTFVKGNLYELDRFRPCPIIYRKESDYLSVAEIEGEAWTSTVRFDSPRDMLMHLKRTGVTHKKSEKTERNAKGSSQTTWRFYELPKELTYRPMVLVIKN